MLGYRQWRRGEALSEPLIHFCGYGRPWACALVLALALGRAVPASGAPLRALQEAPASNRLAEAAGRGELGRALSIFRLYPWADASHQTLLQTGELALRAGRPGWARRCFEDILAHSAHAGLKRRAQSGLWIALGQAPEPTASRRYPPCPCRSPSASSAFRRRPCGRRRGRPTCWRSSRS